MLLIITLVWVDDEFTFTTPTTTEGEHVDYYVGFGLVIIFTQIILRVFYLKCMKKKPTGTGGIQPPTYNIVGTGGSVLN